MGDGMPKYYEKVKKIKKYYLQTVEIYVIINSDEYLAENLYKLRG